MSESNVVRRSVEVSAPPAEAFAMFTDDIGEWYVRDRNTLRDAARTKTIRFESFVGGRLLEVYDLETGEGREMARITEWQPPYELRFVGDRDVEVAITFEGTVEGCRVTVEERGLDRLSADDAAHVRRWGWHAKLPGWFETFARKPKVR